MGWGISMTVAGSAHAGDAVASTQFGTRTHGRKFQYDGRLGELYGIFLINILLSIVTLSIWRFWGKTRVRRYLWAHTSLSGDRFEYTGTGGELFIGFIIVMAAFVLANIGLTALQVIFEPGSPIHVLAQSAFAFVILYLTFVAQYAAQRYRLTRTLWRGISGGMTGSAWAWGLKGMFFSVLSLLSLTLAWPWAQMRLIDDRLNNSYFGDAKASVETSSQPLYLPYILGFLALLVGSGLLGLAVYGILDSTLGDKLSGLFNPNGGPNQGAAVMAVLGSVFVVYLGVIIIGIIAFSAYYVAMAHEIATKLSLGGLRFATPLTSGRLISRYLGNILIIIFTLGLGLPIAIHRTMLFLAANIEIVGEVDGSEITRAELPRPKIGEGLLEAFDPGIL